MGPVRGLRGQRGFVADRWWQGAAINSERAGENEHRRSAERAARVEHGAGAVEVDPVTELGVRLGFAADDCGEVKHRTRAGRDQPRHGVPVGDIAGDQT